MTQRRYRQHFNSRTATKAFILGILSTVWGTGRPGRGAHQNIGAEE